MTKEAISGTVRATVFLAAACAWLLPASRADDKPAPKTAPKIITNSIGMELTLIPAGKFTMGSPHQEAERQDNEGPRHKVKITSPFYMGVYEVTQEEYERVMGNNPSKFKGKKNPVEMISWNMAVQFCKKLSALPEEKRAGRTYRLPTEAEWEYACRAGTTTIFHFGNWLSAEQANFNRTFPNPCAPMGKWLQRTAEVGSYPPNAFGLYDMHGNVSECCADYYGGRNYDNSSNKDPQGPSSGDTRVVRGGSWLDRAGFCRAAARNGCFPDSHGSSDLGFRVVSSPAARTEPPVESKLPPEPKVEPRPEAGTGETFTNSIGMKLSLIPAGKFTMGLPASDKNRSAAEGPQHEVEITKPFYLGVHEVTQEEYEQVTGSNPSNFKGKQNPVEMVSWNEAVEFCKKLSALPEEKRAGRVYRLPTEAEWEYACRSGSSKAYCFGDDWMRQLKEYAWFIGNSGSKTHPVGTRKANAFGLRDMHGNVWEWCADWYDEGYYKDSPRQDPENTTRASLRVLRGGCWVLDVDSCRSAYRAGLAPGLRDYDLGFRVAVVQSLEPKLPPVTKAEPRPEAGTGKTFTNSIGMKLALIPAGKFTMGLPASDKNRKEAEGPQHEVEITKPFYLGVHEVTQEEYEKVTGYSPSNFKGKQNPVEMVSWYEAVEFCKKLSALPKEKRAGRTYRLPTEAEWEYACRGGSSTAYCFGDDWMQLQEYARYSNNSGNKTHPVGLRNANAFGLHDMHGNVWEWCADWYHDGYYKNSPRQDPESTTGFSERVLRGGSWSDDGRCCRSADRNGLKPVIQNYNQGFRVVAVQSLAPKLPPETKVEPRLVPRPEAGTGKTIANSIGMKLVLVPKGKFMMGSPASENNPRDNEGPRHEVEITSPFYMGVTEVTQEEYERMAGSNPSRFKGSKNPVETVSWNEAVEFCKKLSALPEEKRAGRMYRLPTEAEWEYACRGGSSEAYGFGDDRKQLKEYAWYIGNSGGKTHPVGTRKPNDWGLHDMHGNVWEWCADYYGAKYYGNSPNKSPQGPSSGDRRVVRGCSWSSVGSSCRAAYRVGVDPGSRGTNLDLIGFRVVCLVAPRTEPAVQPKLPPVAQVEPRPEARTEKMIFNSIGMRLALIPKGKFMMGSPADEKNRGSDEGPQHEVEITKPFYMSVYEVTQGEYEKVMGSNPSKFKGKGNPVERVSWTDAVEFCRKLSKLPEEKRAGRTYRLPTEAEWEYACRGGSSKAYCFGDDAGQLQKNAWYGNNSGNETHSSDRRNENAFGLCNMHGNVWEWCADWYDEGYYKDSLRQDPENTKVASFRVLRGGGWGDEGGNCRSANRDWETPSSRGIDLGFRVILVPSGR